MDRDPCLFKRDSCILIIHVDDFLATGEMSDLERHLRELQGELSLKVRVMRATEDTSEKYLGRVIRQQDGEFTVSMGSGYAQRLLERLGMSTCKPADAIGQPSQQTDDEVILLPEQAEMYRSCVGILMWIQQERPDLAVVANLLASGMSEPKQGDLRLLKRCARYLQGHQNVGTVMAPAEVPIEGAKTSY